MEWSIRIPYTPPMERANPAFTRRLSGIEGLRGVAATSVVVFHVWTNSAGSPLDLGWPGTYVFPNLARGVQLFFALSGFLLYLPFAAAALRGQARPSFVAYLRNRGLRIFPAYWCILLLTALVLQSARVYQQGVAVTGPITDPWLLLKNVLLIQNYSLSSANTGIGPAWSLAVELIFYLVLPLLVMAGIVLSRNALSRSRRRLMLLVPTLLMAAIGLASAAAGKGMHGEIHDLWFASFLPSAHLFAMGMAIAVLRVEYEDGRLHLPRYWRAGTVVAILVVAAVTVELQVHGRIPESADVALMSVPCSLLLALVVLRGGEARSPWGVRMLESRPFVAAGLISYSVYLWHAPVIYFLRDHRLTLGGGTFAFLFNLAFVLVLTGVLSWMTYRWVEKPAMRFKARRTHAPDAQTVPEPRFSPRQLGETP